jgi:hypothetical protein
MAKRMRRQENQKVDEDVVSFDLQSGTVVIYVLVRNLVGEQNRKSNNVCRVGGEGFTTNSKPIVKILSALSEVEYSSIVQ